MDLCVVTCIYIFRNSEWILHNRLANNNIYWVKYAMGNSDDDMFQAIYRLRLQFRFVNVDLYDTT